MIVTLIYDANGLWTEGYRGGVLAGLSVNNRYNGYLQRHTIQLQLAGDLLSGGQTITLSQSAGINRDRCLASCRRVMTW
jgi:hypothetical protein